MAKEKRFFLREDFLLLNEDDSFGGMIGDVSWVWEISQRSLMVQEVFIGTSKDSK
jgi:hypothetical protein